MSGKGFFAEAVEQARQLLRQRNKSAFRKSEGLHGLLTELVTARHAIEKKYASLGGITGVPRGGLQLGAVGNTVRMVPFRATSPEEDQGPYIGFYRRFEYGTIFWRRDLGARYVHGAMYQKYRDLGCEAGILGYPETDEMEVAGGLGRVIEFEWGAICDHLRIAGGSFLVHGFIFEKWKRLGREAWAFPCTDQSKTGDGAGRYSHFRRLGPHHQNEELSIYWTPFTGAHAVRGVIRERWAWLGWERSYLGYPVTDELDFFDGDTARRGRISWFQHGFILWENHRVVEGRADVQFSGMNRQSPVAAPRLNDDLVSPKPMGPELCQQRQAPAALRNNLAVMPPRRKAVLPEPLSLEPLSMDELKKVCAGACNRNEAAE